MRQTQEELDQAILPTALALCGGSKGTLQSLPAQASTRRYHRVVVPQGHPPSLIVMELDRNAPVSEEADTLRKHGELPFINVQRYLERGGIAVPRLFHYDAGAGLLYLEDLGDTTLETIVISADSSTRRHLYELAIAELIRMQRHGSRPDPSCIAFGRRFDYTLLRWELDHFREWLLEADREVRLSPKERQVLDSAFDRIAQTLAELPPTFVHRDFQSRNLLVQEGSRIRVLDFQDALLGPAPYDLVALLRDSYVELDQALVDQLVRAYVEMDNTEEKQLFRVLFDLQTVQRKLKDAGRFVYIDRVKNNSGFLPSIPASLRYVRSALDRLPEYRELRQVLGEHLVELGPNP